MATERIIIAEVPLNHTGPVVLDIKAASAYLTACGVAASVAALRRWRKEWLRNGGEKGPGPRGYLVTEKQLRYRLEDLEKFIREGDGYTSSEEKRMKVERRQLAALANLDTGATNEWPETA